VQSGHSFVPHPEPLSEVNKVLPQKVNSFFFFDGEKLDDFFKQNSASIVRNAVQDVSQITILNSTLEHLDDTVAAARKRIKHTDPKAIKANNELLRAEKAFNEHKVQHKKLQDQIEENDIRKQEFWARANAQNAEILKVQRRNYETMQSEINGLEATCTNVEKEAIDLILTSGPAIICNDAISKVYGMLDAALERGPIPGSIPRAFIRDLLDSNQCICERELREGLARKSVEKLLGKSDTSDLTGDLVRMKYVLAKLRENVNSFRSGITAKRTDIADKEVDLKKKRSKLAEISAKMDTLVEESGDSRFSFTQLDDKGRELEGKIAVHGAQLADKKKEYEKAKRKVDKAVTKDQANAKKQRKVNLGEEVISLFAGIKEALVNETREILQKKTKEYFLRLLWKKDTYVDVRIDENYSIAVMNNLGTDCLTMLSAGERQVLALSFLAALREVSGFDAPIVIDTPLGRISTKPKENIARLLPEFFGDSQVILLVTDEEYTKEVKRLLSSRVAIEYVLDYVEEDMKTEVKRVVN
jgi:DNA sulfur modification protein DndD